jgi:TRAP-type C4-dicarboxylate transport system substrate-binding protein
MGVGASVITEKTFNAIPDDAREVLQRITKETHGKLLKAIRSDNNKAVNALVDKGIKVVEPDDFLAWANAAVRVRKELTGSLFDEALVNEMMSHL